MDYNKANKEAYDSIAKHWDTKRHHSWTPVREYLQKIEDKENKNIVDLGCGSGRDLVLAKELGFKNIIGSDFSASQLKIVEEKGFKVKKSELTKLPFKDKEFDVVISIAAFHHLIEKEKQEKALNEIRRISKGNILLVIWNPEKDFIENEVKKGKFKYLDKKIVRVTYDDGKNKHDRYYYMFEEEELVEMCKKAGFKVKKTYTIDNNLYLELV